MHDSVLPRSNSFTLARLPLKAVLDTKPPAAIAGDELSPALPGDAKANVRLRCDWYEELAPNGTLHLRCRWVAR
jgi:hypothetical protein